MKIEELNLPDVTDNNLEESKVLLANSIIKNIYPLFDNIFMDKKNKIEELKTHLVRRENIIKKKKELVQEFASSYEKEKTITQFLSEVENLMNTGMIMDSSVKHQVIVMLKTLDKFSQDKIKSRIIDIKRVLGKRFGRA
jgi:hypothetical protein